MLVVLCAMCFLKSSKIFFIYLGAPMLGAYMFTTVISPCWTASDADPGQQDPVL